MSACGAEQLIEGSLTAGAPRCLAEVLAGMRQRQQDLTGDNTMILTALTEMLGLQHPILLGPMGGVAGGHLAATVAAAAPRRQGRAMVPHSCVLAAATAIPSAPNDVGALNRRPVPR